MQPGSGSLRHRGRVERPRGGAGRDDPHGARKVFRHPEAEIPEELDVLRQAGEPVLAADHVRRLHQVVVDRVREVIRRDPGRLEYDYVLEVRRHLELAPDAVDTFLFDSPFIITSDYPETFNITASIT